MLRIPCLMLMVACGLVICIDSCDVDSDCGQNRCCRPMFGLSNCGDLISVEGDRCGAATLCGCARGLKCVADSSATVWTTFKRGNGTCVKDSLFHDLDSQIAQRFDSL